MEEIKIEICPVCGENALEDQTEIFRVCKEHGLNGNLCNPGGRQLRFTTKEGWLQISDMCNHCDAEKIKKFLGVIE